ncbi:TPA: VaFE repeat-containing surface-anchored protein [Streptococcus equi subsp. zooepidemicus]|nr:VaFE repeat-containing surface-anchored protein [Streptococcus equi subsp. zooepidemicus]HEL0011303.1 VaFE repeat-containing surface-anchored protein [Streptococcus equi subsp. zooepidemicus]HEL0013373.1 VaFE repeat-containing surface-anchored protein [Streptococcus equi subsp. zooepidemicus]HEL0017481.1 VaFE repeat-containing surface-anchored protein [Streptococcus equi subsp. zooepidemicus]HEL0029337.1 VaFE repeat-containing surface-anchored protein [Streptococcus equi subsp. zooepidemicus
MNKIFKKGIAILLTFFTICISVMPSVVHAEEKQYWTESTHRVGKVEKITDTGETASTFNEGHLTVEGEEAFCVDLNTNFKNGYKKKHDIYSRLSKEQVSAIALANEYITELANINPQFTSDQVYLLKQCMTWRNLSEFLGWHYGGVRAAEEVISVKLQEEIFSDAKNFAKENKDRYECGGALFIGDGQDLGQFWAKLNVGKTTFKKVSKNPKITSKNNLYTLVNAKYGIFKDKDCTELVTTFTTDEDGSSEELELICGTFFVKELEAPKGFEVDDTIYTLDIEAGKKSELVLEDIAKYTLPEIEIIKKDIDITKPQGDASLEDATFTWKYYDGYYTKDTLPNSALKTWTTKSIYQDGRYISKLEDVYKVDGDDFYTDSKRVVLPLGTLVVEETKAPKGYLLDNYQIKLSNSELLEDGRCMIHILDEEKAKLDLNGSIDVLDHVIRGGVKIQKRDLETGQTKAQGGASLKNAAFNITSLNDNDVLVEGKLFKKNEVVKTLSTGLDGSFESKNDLLPYGKYRLSEKEAPLGYLLSDAYIDFEIRENGQIVDLTDSEHSIYNQIKRGDLKGIKIADKTHKRLSEISFKITSKTTGESHVVVTDDNGEFSTESSFAKHSYHTNQGKSSEDGIWFGSSKVNDEKGALPYDTYIIEELESKNNKEHKLIPPFEVVISKDAVTVNLGTLTDEYKEKVVIKTKARGEDGSQEIEAKENTKIIDKVEIKGLEKGSKYKVKGYQIIKEENKKLLINENPVENEKEFVADEKDLDLELDFVLDSSHLSGKHLVTYEELYILKESGEWEKIAEHKNIEDKDQTIYVKDKVVEEKIEIKTLARGENGKKEIEAGKNTKIVDIVDMKNLKKDSKYRVKGYQMIKEDKKELVIGNEKIEVTREFVAKDKNQKEEVVFIFDSTNLSGKTLVTFEELYEEVDGEWKKVAEHKDIDDKDQSVLIKEKQEPKETQKETYKKSDDKKPEKINKGTLPKTGDTSNIGLYIGVALLSSAGVIGSIIYRKKRK